MIKPFRVELRIDPTEPLGAALGHLSGRERNRLVRALLEAALLPGGWARLAERCPDVGATPESEPATSSDASEDSPDSAPPTTMSETGARSFLAGLRQFGASED